MLDSGNAVCAGSWFRVYPKRFAAEREGLEARGFILNEKLLEDELLVEFRGHLEEYPDRKLIIRYPRSFPSTAPKLFDDGDCRLLDRHQRADNRAYCLYGPNENSWHAGLDGVHAVIEVRKLITDVISGATGLDPKKSDFYPEPVSAQVETAGDASVLVPPGVSDLVPRSLDQVSEGVFSMMIDFKSRPIRGVVMEAGFKGVSDSADANQGYRRLGLGKVVRGRVVYLPVLERPVSNRSDLLAILNGAGLKIAENYGWYALVFPEQSGTRTGSRLSWQLLHREKSGNFVAFKTYTYRSSEKDSRIPGLGFLHEKRVAIVGCGSLGSKVAKSLASSGVCDFLLVDKELFSPENSIRHECGVDSFGIPKVLALYWRLLSLNPDSKGRVDIFAQDPFGCLKIEHLNGFHEKLSKCDVVLHATGSEGVARALSEICSGIGLPVVHVSVTNGAWSGEVFRMIPRRSGCWLCFRDAFSDAPPSEEAPEGFVFGPGCDQPTFTGATHDLDIVSAFATSAIVDSLRIKSGLTPEQPADYLLWERIGDDGVLLNRASTYSVGSREGCKVCSAK